MKKIGLSRFLFMDRGLEGTLSRDHIMVTKTRLAFNLNYEGWICREEQIKGVIEACGLGNNLSQVVVI